MLRFIGSSLAASVVFVLAVSTSASGQDDKWVLVDDCLSGAAPPSAEVSAYDVGGRTISLRCGTPITTGVLHIDADHEIGPGAEFDFTHCVFNVFAKGAPRGQGNGPSLQVVDRDLGDGRDAIGVYDTSRNEIVTLYVTGSVSNDWAACSRLA